MLLKTFKSNQPSVLIIIPIIAVIIWFNPSISSEICNSSIGNMPLYSILTKLAPLGTITSKIIGLLFVLSIGLLITRLNTKFIFIPDRSYLPTIIYIILVLGISINHDLSPILPATLLIIISIEKLLETFKSEQITYKIFDSSILIGIASLFYFNSIFLILFIWSTLLILRPFYLKEWIYSFLGVVVCYFLLFGYYYLTSKDFMQIISSIQSNFILKQQYLPTIAQMLFGSISIIILLISSRYLLNSLSSKKIFTRKTFNLFLILFLLALAIFLTVKSTSTELIVFIAIPLSVLFSHFFILARISKWLELIFTIFLLSFALTQFKL